MPGSRRGLDRWVLFAGMWGWVLLLHQATFDRWQYSPLGWALNALALALVLQPRSRALLAATVVVDAAYTFQCLPQTANHLVFEGLLCATWSAVDDASAFASCATCETRKARCCTSRTCCS